MNIKEKTKGFTIIEVVLVLAIAGLIFLVVFLAVPALQRSQRDEQRRADAGRFLSQLAQFQTNNAGAVPVADAPGIAAFQTAYLTVGGQTFADPQAGAYQYATGVGAAPAAGTIRYATGARCAAGGAIAAPVGTGARQVAVSVGLETGGASCLQN